MDSINQVKAARTRAESKIIEACKAFEKETKMMVIRGNIQLNMQDGKYYCNLEVDIFETIKPASNIVDPGTLKPVK